MSTIVQNSQKILKYISLICLAKAYTLLNNNVSIPSVGKSYGIVYFSLTD